MPAAGPLDPYLARDDITVRRFEARRRPAARCRHAVLGRRRDRRARAAVHATPPRLQHARRAPCLRRARSAARARVRRRRRAIVLSPWRGEEIPLPGGGFVVNDAYNANPDSMRAALEHLAERAGERRKVAILGEMAELGESAPAYHLAIGELARGLGIAVIGVGEPSRAYEPVAWAADADGRRRRGARVGRTGRRGPRQGVPRRRARRHRRRDHELRPSMVPVLIAGLIAMVAAVVIGPKFIELLRTRNLGQQIRAEGPATHVVKQGTPTMGGLLIIASAVIPFLFLSQYTAEGLTVLFMVLGCALIGFTDDYLKLRKRHSLGLPGRWKMVGLAVVTVVAALLLNESSTLLDRRVRTDRQLDARPLLGLLRAALPAHRRHRQRCEPHRRDRRARGRCLRDHAADVPRDRGHRLDPLGRPRRAQRHAARHRDARRRAHRRDDRVPLVQRLPRRGVHGRHRARSPSAARSPGSRSSPARRSSCR